MKGGVSISKPAYYIQIYFILTLYWASLFELFSAQILIYGLIFSVIAVFISEKLALHDSYYNLYYFNILKLPLYFCTLLVEIYRSSFAVIPAILSGKSDLSIISIPTNIKNDFQVSIMANSITLTPGTITIDMKENELMILWLNPKTSNSSAAGDIIKGRFEKILKEASK